MGWSEPYWPLIAGPLMMIMLLIICMGVMLFMMRVMNHRFRDKTPDILKERFARGGK